MIYDDFKSLRVDRVGERLVLRQSGAVSAIMRGLMGGFCFAVGGLVLLVFVTNLAQGLLLPIEPRTWYKWLLWAAVMALFAGMLIVMPITMGIEIAQRDRFTFDPRGGTLVTWRGLFGVPVRRRSHALNQFREIVIRPRQSGVFGKRWHWIVLLAGETSVALVSADRASVARMVAGQISQVTQLPIVEQSADA
ncbi:MAG TPA: hypothetical protein VGG30_06980 [Pirellulales bacterium]